MFIEVVSKDKPVPAQARAYAEYRVFSTLVRHTRMIERVQVLLESTRGRQGADVVTCVVDVSLAHSGNVHSRSTRGNAYDAIDRAAKTLGNLITRRSKTRR